MKKIKIGNKVRFLNEVGGGTVKRIIDKQLVEVETGDGWAIPYLISELVVMPDDPNEEPFRASGNPVVFHDPAGSVKKGSNMEEDPKVLLLAVRDADKQGMFTGIRWYLVNDSDFTLNFAFYQEDELGIKVVEIDVLEPGTKFFLQELSLADLSGIKSFHVQGMLTDVSISKLPPVISGVIPFNTKKFSQAGAYLPNDYLHEDAVVFNAAFKESERKEEVVIPKETVEESFIAGSKPRVSRKPDPPREIDLHINQLVDSVVGMSNREILRIQMETFERELNKAIETGEKEIIFIHGIGNGTLKETLRKAIDSDYPVCSQEDASFKDYGFGATSVRIRQNR